MRSQTLPVGLTLQCGYHLLKEPLYCMVSYFGLVCYFGFSFAFNGSHFSKTSCSVSECLFVYRTAGLPQYGQLGHGTDNEVT